MIQFLIGGRDTLNDSREATRPVTGYDVRVDLFNVALGKSLMPKGIRGLANRHSNIKNLAIHE